MTQRRVRRVALTGGIATGKSYVRRRLEAAGVPTIDSDVLAREAVHAGSPGLAALVQRFGPEMLTPDGALDRRAMARLVFDDETARRDLEAIVHPVVRSATDAWYERLAAQGEATLAVADVPLLYETGRDRDFDSVIVTTCPASVQIARVMARDGLTDAEARARIAAQWPLPEKVRRAHYVIDTGGSFADTDRAVDGVLSAIRSE